MTCGRLHEQHLNMLPNEVPQVYTAVRLVSLCGAGTLPDKTSMDVRNVSRITDHYSGSLRWWASLIRLWHLKRISRITFPRTSVGNARRHATRWQRPQTIITHAGVWHISSAMKMNIVDTV